MPAKDPVCSPLRAQPSSLRATKAFPQSGFPKLPSDVDFVGAPRTPHQNCRQFRTGRVGPGSHTSSLVPLFSIGPLGIEPSPHAPKACILPIYYGPSVKSGWARNIHTTTITALIRQTRRRVAAAGQASGRGSIYGKCRRLRGS